MVSLVVSSILVGMILAIWSRMSLAYRGQQSVAELQQLLSAAHDRIGTDLRQAGFQMADGFFVASDQTLHQPVEIIDDADGFGPDQVRIYTADASAAARVVDFNGGLDSATAPFTTLLVDDATDFVDGDLALIVKTQDGAPQDIGFYPCVVQISTKNANQLSLVAVAPWGTNENNQCDQVRTDAALGPDSRAMVYRFRARAYRIDPQRLDLAVLQVSNSGGAVNDWEDLGIGFTDLQIASRWADDDDNTGLATTDTPDLDADPTREWWSDGTQDALSGPLAATIPVPPTNTPTPYVMGSYDMTRPRLISARVSLVVRSHTRSDIVPTARTPALVDTARPANNELGNRDAIQLEGVADGARPEELRGDYVYRYATAGTDLRNLGVGL